jgi:Fe2+ or Zn2+ uptake regulation protein
MDHDAQHVADLLRAQGIQPSAQRVAVARYVLFTDHHPTADQVWSEVRRDFPVISRATVYNTLNLFADKGLLQSHNFDEGAGVFDANTAPHHHFIDEETGRIVDIPIDRLRVSGIHELEGFDVDDFRIVLRGRVRRGDRS